MADFGIAHIVCWQSNVVTTGGNCAEEIGVGEGVHGRRVGVGDRVAVFGGAETPTVDRDQNDAVLDLSHFRVN